jgi:hypothetical protein
LQPHDLGERIREKLLGLPLDADKTPGFLALWLPQGLYNQLENSIYGDPSAVNTFICALGRGQDAVQKL